MLPKVSVHRFCCAAFTDVDNYRRLVGDELRAEGAGVLVVARRDRLARDVTVAVTIEKAVARCAARVVSADGVANGETAADEFLRTNLDAAAAYERALIRARTKAALAVKKAEGVRVGSVPLGYRLGADGRTLEPCEREQAVLRDAGALRARGLSLRAIARELATLGHAPRGAARWHPELVRTLVRWAVARVDAHRAGPPAPRFAELSRRSWRRASWPRPRRGLACAEARAR